MTSTTARLPRLSSSELAEFRREGYLVFRDPVFPRPEFDALKAHFEEKLARLEPGTRPEAMDCPHFADTALFRWLFADGVLDLIQPILGPDIVLFASHFICKPGGHGKRVPWHEDSWYWKGMMDPMQVVTVWLAIDPSTRDNGCMQVIPRTQDNGYSDYAPVDARTNVFDAEIKQADQFEQRAVAIELQPNQASLHDGKLIHGSAANTSPQRRCGYTMRYISAATRFDHTRFPNHNLYLARGRDHANANRYANPAQTYPALARFRERTTGH